MLQSKVLGDKIGLKNENTSYGFCGRLEYLKPTGHPCAYKPDFPNFLQLY